MAKHSELERREGCLQDLALAQDMTRGVILDSIFRQVDRLGNISIAVLQHYVTNKGKVKWDDKVSDKDKAEAVSPLLAVEAHHVQG